MELLRLSEPRGRSTPPRWAGLKFFNVYGPNEAHKGGQRSVAHQIFRTVIRNEPVKVFASDNPRYSDGEQLRDFVWIGDCVAAVLWLLDGQRGNGIYNVAALPAASPTSPWQSMRQWAKNQISTSYLCPRI
jgi:ADP-L-glycero-D-manno-heptose 6-epimerase